MPAEVDLDWPAGQWEGAPGDGTRNGDPPRGETLASVARATNHNLAQGRIIFAQAYPHTSLLVSANGTPTLARWRYRDWNTDAGRLRFVAVLRAKDDTLNANAAILDFSPTEILRHAAFGTAPTVPEDIFVMEGTISRIPDGSLRDDVVRAVDGMTVHSLTVFEQPDDEVPFILDGTQDFVDPTRFQPGLRIVGDAGSVLEELSEKQEAIYHEHRDIWGWSMPQPGTAATAITVASTSFTNLFDGSATGRLARRPGIVCRSLRGGYGLRQLVEARVEVYAEAINLGGGESGEVNFVSSRQTRTVTGIGALGWYAAASKLELDTRPAASHPDGRAWEMVTVEGRVTAMGAGQTLRVWAARVEPEPD